MYKHRLSDARCVQHAIYMWHVQLTCLHVVCQSLLVQLCVPDLQPAIYYKYTLHVEAAQARNEQLDWP